jgi:hypothetical protein
MVEMKKNSLTIIGISILFLGLAIAPSINANVSKEGELIEIITEIYGPGGGMQTVHLTKEEAEEVDKIFDTIRLRINESSSREEVNRIFKEAVVELDRYGLLGGLSVKQAQRLVVSTWILPVEQRMIDAIYHKLTGSSNDFDNAYCQIFGRITNALYFAYWVGMYKLIWAKVRGYQWIPAFLPCFLGANFRRISIKRASLIAIGSTRYGDYYREYYPSMGRIWTNGTEGVKQWNGFLKGGYFELTYAADFASWSQVGHIGVKIFRGLNFVKNDVTRFFGFAKEVKILKWSP